MNDKKEHEYNDRLMKAIVCVTVIFGYAQSEIKKTTIEAKDKIRGIFCRLRKKR